MTKEELEKEAEDKAFEKYPIPRNWNEIEFARNTKYEEGFKDGAEFGYNKANEWHYMKDGDLPKEKQLVMVYRVNPLGANIAITNWYDSYKDTKVIAWKEIVLPKEIE